MKATIVLLADIEAENFGRKCMLEAHRTGNVGFEMARLPHHISLKQPFRIPNLDRMEDIFDEFAMEWNALTVPLLELNYFPSNVFGYESGVLSIRAESTPQLVAMQEKLFELLEFRLGPCPAEHDLDYVFHMTIAIGGTSYENYEKAYQVMKKHDYHHEFQFNRLGLLYYDDDNIKPGTYFCYKIARLKKQLEES
jgi:2'-5' RNA ligase